jgi:hypothetical protein
MKKSVLSVIPLAMGVAWGLSGCATKASQYANKPGSGHLNPVKQAGATLLSADPNQAFETTQVFKATDVLPVDVIMGAHHSVDNQVLNDGYLNVYTLHSSYGDLKVVSKAMLYKRIQEISAIAKIEEISGLKEFGGGVAEKGKDVVMGAVNLVTSPIDTVSQAVTGVGKLFKRAGENVLEQSRSDAEDNRFKSVIGFSKTKRDYAYDMNVDVYSRNPLLQDALDNLTWSGYSGNMAMSLVVSVFTGPITTATGTTNLLNKVFRDTAPADLRILNRKKLADIGVSASLIDRYITNPVFTPREQTVIVDALERMNTTTNREAFIRFAIPTDDPDVAFFRQRQAEMYSNYSERIMPVTRFVNLGRFVAGVTREQDLVICFPMDHLLWTQDIARVAELLNREADALGGIRNKKMILGGTVSSLAQTKINELGWEIAESML